MSCPGIRIEPQVGSVNSRIPFGGSIHRAPLQPLGQLLSLLVAALSGYFCKFSPARITTSIEMESASRVGSYPIQETFSLLLRFSLAARLCCCTNLRDLWGRGYGGAGLVVSWITR